MIKRNRKNNIKLNWGLLSCWALLYLTVFLVLLFVAHAGIDPDLGWHLRVGKDTVLDGRAQNIERYTFPTLGKEWVDHEWLGNVIVFELYDLGGANGYWLLSLLFSALMLGTFHMVISITKKIALPKCEPWNFFFFGSIVLLLSTLSIFSSFGIRLQVISWFFVVLYWIIFIKIHIEKKYFMLWLFPLLSVLWANLHGSFIFGLAMLFPFMLFALIFGNLNKKHKMMVAASTLLSLCATLATPYHYKLWSLIAIEYTQNRSYLGKIQEWLPLFSVPHVKWIVTFQVAFFIATLVLALKSKLLKNNAEIYLYLSFVFISLVATIASRRFAPFFILSSMPLLIFAYAKTFDYIRVGKTVIMTLLILTASVCLFVAKKISALPRDQFKITSSLVPYDATNFLKNQKELQRLNLFNIYSWGGYLDWAWPQKHIFIDGRMPQRPLDNGNTYLDEYYAFFDSDKISTKFDEYDIDLALVNPDKPFSFNSGFEKLAYKYIFAVDESDFRSENFLVSYLEDNWNEIYEDDFSVIYKRP